MGAKLSRGTAVAGAVAFQDDAVPSQFHYLPARAQCVLGETLLEFDVKYWGVGKPFYYADDTTKKSAFGAVVSGRAAIDLTDAQRTTLIAEIKRAFPDVGEPRLLPLGLRKVKVTPVFAGNTLSVGKGASDVIFPEVVNFGSTFNFLVGSGNSLFAQYAAARQADGDVVQPNSGFAINVVGSAEFVGDPWDVDIEANLTQFWRYLRRSVSAGVRIGWFKLGSGKYNQVIQELKRDGHLKVRFNQGSLDDEKYGAQIFELGKRLAEELQKRVAAGEGLFKLEANPAPPSLLGDGARESADAARFRFNPFGVSINAAYSEVISKQEISWNENVQFTGRHLIEVPASMSLAVGCGSLTKRYFQDLGDASEPCITQPKTDRLNARIAKEVARKNQKLQELADRLLAGSITPEVYDRLLVLYNTISFEEDGKEQKATEIRIRAEDARKETVFSLPESLVLGLSDSEISALEDGSGQTSGVRSDFRLTPVDEARDPMSGVVTG